MRVDEIMSRGVLSIPSTAVVADAVELIVTRGALNLLVMEGARVVGTLSIRELSGQSQEQPVARIMNRDFKTASPTTTLRDAARLMIGRTAGCVPVLDGGRVVGLLTSSDLMRVLVRENGGAASPAHDTV